MSLAAAGHRLRPPQREGEIGSETIPALIHALSQQRATGILTVTDDAATRTLHLGDGRLVSAASDLRDERLSHFLLRSDVVPLQGLMKALEMMVATRDRLGDVLVRLGLAKREDIEACVRVQVREIAYATIGLSSGDFRFEPRAKGEETIATAEPGDQIVVDGIKRLPSWARAIEHIGGLHTEYLATREAGSLTRDLTLEDEERRLLALCEQPASLEEICDASPLRDYDICKVLWALLVIGALMKA